MRGLGRGSLGAEANSLDVSCKGATQELGGDGCIPGLSKEVESLKRELGFQGNQNLMAASDVYAH